MNCDIVIPVWNQLVFTRDCVDSIRKNTKAAYRIILIDNASSEETRDYLRSLSKDTDVSLIRNEENLGFVKAVNQGLAASRAPYLCILNNDTVVTGGWLDEMISIAEKRRYIGIVNPSSNNLGQKPLQGEPVDLYAESLARERGRFVELGSCIGFCMLIKREVIERLGNFDEIYGMGNFEDTDFSRRAVKEGYRCVRACGAYVYHRENTSFKKIKTFDEDFRRNRAIYEFRWGKPKRVAYILDSYDNNTLVNIKSDAMELARMGNWVWFFMKGSADLPEHSNIKRVQKPDKNFYPAVLFDILKKKKRFDEIVLGSERFGRILGYLAFIHKAKINYY